MRRRIEIARVLLHDPELLLLDEPGRGVDPEALRRIWDELGALRDQRGVSIIVTTHQPDEAERCDRIAILDAGRVCASGTPDELRARVAGDVVSRRRRQPRRDRRHHPGAPGPGRPHRRRSRHRRGAARPRARPAHRRAVPARPPAQHRHRAPDAGRRVRQADRTGAERMSAGADVSGRPGDAGHAGGGRGPGVCRPRRDGALVGATCAGSSASPAASSARWRSR